MLWKLQEGFFLEISCKKVINLEQLTGNRKLLRHTIRRNSWKQRVFSMAIYILLSRLTPEGRKTVKERPGRIKEVDKELEDIGVRVIEQYATLGRYDFVNIVEAPDNETIGKVSVDLCSRGTVELVTLPAVSVESLVESLNRTRAEKMSPTPSGEDKDV